jgi:hypothetical protein
MSRQELMSKQEWSSLAILFDTFFPRSVLSFSFKSFPNLINVPFRSWYHMDNLGVIILILTSVAPVVQYLVSISQSFHGFLRKHREELIDVSETEPVNHQSVLVPMTLNQSIETPPRPPSPSKDKARPMLKRILKRLKRKRKGYNGVHHRKTAFVAAMESAAPSELGSCFECGLQKPPMELQDQAVVDGHTVGICNDCYPEFIRFLQEEEAGDPCR